MIRLTREVRFSVDRDWAGHVEFSRPITNSWGGWPSAVGIVPYLRLRATIAGRPDPRTGFLCNISALDRLLRERAIPYTAEQLAERGWRESAERLLEDVWRRLDAQPAESGVPGALAAPGKRGAVGQLVELELCVTPYLRYTIQREAPGMVLLTQQFEFSAAHRLHCPELSDEQNRAIFGKCNNPSGHGHNYLVEVTVAGTPDAATGAVLPLPRLEQIVKERVIDVLDHKHLNNDTAEFRGVNPSVEMIARVIFGMLREHVVPARLHRVRVYETPKTWAECGGD